MVYEWKPWTQYNTGAVVEYEGGLWTVVQGHQSEPNWQPPNVPALFSRLPEEEHDDYHSGRKHHGVEEHHHNQPQHQGGGGGGGNGGDYPHQPAPGYGNSQQPWQQEQQHQGGGQSEEKKEEKEENWLEEHKLEVGGGIVGAIAVGAGIWAYSHHKSKEEEEAKKKAWMESSDRDNWRRGADNRTQSYEQGGQRPPVYWVLVRDGLPQNAIVGGQENGEPLYVARGFYKNGLHPGKYSTHWKEGASIAYGGKEHHVSDFEVLVGNPNAIRWIPVQGQTFVQGWTPVEGGREEDGTFLFVCHAEYNGGVHPGKAVEGKTHCNISWGGKEHLPERYEVLAYA